MFTIVIGKCIINITNSIFRSSLCGKYKFGTNVFTIVFNHLQASTNNLSLALVILTPCISFHRKVILQTCNQDLPKKHLPKKEKFPLGSKFQFQERKKKQYNIYRKFRYLWSSCSLVPPSWTGSYRPVSKFTHETGFLSNWFPTSTRFSKFSFVALSTEDKSPVSVSSWFHSKTR